MIALRDSLISVVTNTKGCYNTLGVDWCYNTGVDSTLKNSGVEGVESKLCKYCMTNKMKWLKPYSLYTNIFSCLLGPR